MGNPQVHLVTISRKGPLDGRTVAPFYLDRCYSLISAHVVLTKVQHSLPLLSGTPSRAKSVTCFMTVKGNGPLGFLRRVYRPSFSMLTAAMPLNPS